ncbi:MAG: NADH:flavin oxidoreductase [Lentisphaeria bacterium]|nr:NADH:flavin oxidoreductase [Lentisphaeria bacterium]
MESFRAYLKQENINIGLADLPPAEKSALAQPIEHNGRTIGNRWAILPMEGWDCTDDGAPSEYTRRRWLNFAASGAKLIYGTEAAAVMHSGRSNPQQLMVAPHTAEPLKNICAEMRKTHREKFGTDEDLLIGLQLTHSGRYSHPNQAAVLESVTAYSHPLLDVKFNSSAANVVSDEEVKNIIQHFIQAAVIAQKAGFDFVDIKHAHGYLAHELLSAVDRPGDYGGSFENRTRFFRETAEGIRSCAPGLRLAMRLSLADFLPYIKNAEGQGEPMEWQGHYPYAFGGDGTGYGWDFTEPAEFVRMAHRDYGLEMICATIGSPYYNVHIQRPAYYAVSDGYPPPVHPLLQAARHLEAVKLFKQLVPEVPIVGSGYTCFQDYLPHVGEAVLRAGEADYVGIGRMVLSYPEICADTLAHKPLDRCRICRTFGDCTTAPRHGMVSGCYPLDHFYRERPEAARLKEVKKAR